MTPSAQQIMDTEGGVVMEPPPGQYISETTRIIEDAVAHLGPNDRGILTWVATTKGVNLALVDKINDHVDVSAFIGKNWGSPLEAGVVGRISW